MQKANTDLEKTREELLYENDRLRGDLFTIARRVCHDLRTPLNGIFSVAEALKEILGQTDPASVPLALVSLDSAEEISRLIKRVSFVVQATARPLSMQPVAMAEAVSAAGQRLEWEIVNAGSVISQPDSWPAVEII